MGTVCGSEKTMSKQVKELKNVNCPEGKNNNEVINKHKQSKLINLNSTKENYKYAQILD